MNNGKLKTTTASSGNSTMLESDFFENNNTETSFENVEGLLDKDHESVSTSNENAAFETSYELPGAESGSSETTLDQLPKNAIEASYSEAELNSLFALSPKKESLSRAEAEEVIIGADNRIRINPPSNYPFRAICALRIRSKTGKMYIGTGWLVGPRTVITAGHCVYLHNEGGWAASIEVIPAMNDNSRPYGSFSSSNLRSVTGWTNSKNRENDYGAIILNDRIGDRAGFFGVAVRSDDFLRNSNLNLSGYPADKGGNQQWFMAQRPKAVSSRVITYDIDTYGGHSGSPVWIIQNNQRYAVGIHTNGHTSGNSATRIVQAVFNNIVNWKNV